MKRGSKPGAPLAWIRRLFAMVRNILGWFRNILGWFGASGAPRQTL
jgi:hypothetical protein